MAASRSSGARKESYAALLKELTRARVISVSAEQVDALPRTFGHQVSEFTPLITAARLPFDPVFLDLGSVSLEPWVNDAEVHGALCTRSWPEQPGVTAVIPFVGLTDKGEKQYGATAAVMPHPSGNMAVQDLIGMRAEGFSAAEIEESQKCAVDAAERGVAVLGWLQSFNVELIEAPLRRREREREEKKGRQIALTIQIKQSKRYLSASTGDGKANYSHRFETRGHYAHYFEKKANGEPSQVFAACLRKDPSRLVSVDGQPCFRFWRPPHVKGPADKPFVPKVRVAEGVS